MVIAGITFLADYKFGWDATKAGTFWAVLVYFTLNGALTLWIWGVEKGKVYTGEIEQSTAERSSVRTRIDRDGGCSTDLTLLQLSIASSVTKHVPIYNITVRYESGGQESKTLELSSPFTRWFDADGFFVAKPFQQWLASEIPLIGQADAQNKTSKPAIEGTQDCSSGADHSSEKAKTETPKKSAPNDAVPPSTRSRKGRKSSDR